MRKRLKTRKHKVLRVSHLGKNFTYLFFIFLVLSAFFSVLIMSNELSTKGSEIRLLEEKKSRLIITNSLLVNERDELGSLNRIKKEAESKLGMVEDPQSFEYLSKTDFAYER